MRDVALERPTKRARAASITGLFVLGFGLALLFVGVFGGQRPPVRLCRRGCGARVRRRHRAQPAVRARLARAIGAPLRAIKGITGTLARENAARNPKRTATTAAALMIGVALVGFITIFAASARRRSRTRSTSSCKIDYIVTSGTGFGDRPEPGARRVDPRAAGDPVARRRCGSAPRRSTGSGDFLVAADPQATVDMFDFDVKSRATSPRST